MREKMNKIGNLCFWIALVIESVIVMIDKSAYINPWEGKLFRLTFVLFCIKVITTQYSKKEWIAIAIAGILVSISYLVNDKDEVVRAAVFVISCKNIDVNIKGGTWHYIGRFGNSVCFSSKWHIWCYDNDGQFWPGTISGHC